MKKFGIVILLATLMAAVRLTKKIDGALEDHKISPLEWGEIGVAGFQFGWSLTNMKQIAEEYNDLDPDERFELIDKFAVELKLRNDDAEQLVEKLFAVLVQLSSIFQKPDVAV